MASPVEQLDVFFTVDVEVWCDGWRDIDAKFPDAFRRYVYGPTPAGSYGLPFQLQLLREHGLVGVCFVEPLFSTRFGVDPLTEIVGLVRDAGHETQLHLHTEWVDEARVPLLSAATGKRQFLHQFSLPEQTALIRKGCELLCRAGASKPIAFRAGSFGFNRDTLSALRANGLPIDSSYNATMFGPDSGVAPGSLLLDTAMVDDVLEIPMTVFDVAGRKPRHVQLGACSFAEIEGLLWRALEAGRKSFVILSHNFELLNAAKSGRDNVVVKRLGKLCAFLDRHRAHFCLRGYSGLHPEPALNATFTLTSSWWKAGVRTVEQLYRKRYR